MLVLVLLSLFAWAPLLYPGYLQVHSGFLSVFNLADLAASSNKLGWLPTVGANTGLLRGEGPLAYWLALLLQPFAGTIGAVKGVFALSILAGGLGVAVWTRYAFTGWVKERDIIERAALLAAVVFMLWPPLLMTVYVRGALAEVVFGGLLLWALWSVTVGRARSETGPSKEESGLSSLRHFRLSIVITVLVMTLLFLTQAGLALWATAVLVAWAAWPGAPTRSRIDAAAAVLAGAAIGLGALWLLHGGIAAGSQPVDMAAHAVYPYQLFSPAWSFGISSPDWKGDLPLQLGLAALALAMMTVVLGVGFSRTHSGQSRANGQSDVDEGAASPVPAEEESIAPTPGGFWRSALGFCLIAGLVLVVLATTAARPLWTVIPALASTLAYPWQLYALVGPLLALLAGAVLLVDRRLALLPATAGLLAFVVLASAPALSPRFTQVDPGPAPAAIFGANQVTLLTATASFAPESTTPGSMPSTLLPPPSTALTVTLTWQALEPIGQDYNLFVHALDGAGNTLAQWDGQPSRGQDPYPMTQWPVGAIVPTTIRLELPAEQAAAVQQVVAGLYDWQTGARLSTGNDDKAVITPSSVPGSEVSP